MIEYTNSQITSMIDELVHNERDRRIMKRRFVDGLTFGRLSEEFDLTEQRIKAIVYKNWKRIIAKM